MQAVMGSEEDRAGSICEGGAGRKVLGREHLIRSSVGSPGLGGSKAFLKVPAFFYLYFCHSCGMLLFEA